MNESPRVGMVISPRWMQAIILTFLFGFAVLGYLAIRVYEEHPPVPGKVVDADGSAVFSGEDIRDGQELFLTYGLMQYGSITVMEHISDPTSRPIISIVRQK